MAAVSYSRIRRSRRQPGKDAMAATCCPVALSCTPNAVCGERLANPPPSHETEVWVTGAESKTTCAARSRVFTSYSFDARHAGKQPQLTDVHAASNHSPVTMGCKHYKRNCMLLAPCCNEYFWCRHCHNEEKNAPDQVSNGTGMFVEVHSPRMCSRTGVLLQGARRHTLHRHSIAQVKCMACYDVQPVAAYCRRCKLKFGAYSCLKCNLFDDATDKNQCVGFTCSAIVMNARRLPLYILQMLQVSL